MSILDVEQSVEVQHQESWTNSGAENRHSVEARCPRRASVHMKKDLCGALHGNSRKPRASETKEHGHLKKGLHTWPVLE